MQHKLLLLKYHILRGITKSHSDSIINNSLKISNIQFDKKKSLFDHGLVSLNMELHTNSIQR
jgi:hypothetical protein